VNPVNWSAVLGIGLCLLAIAIIFAVSAGFYVAHQWFERQKAHHQKKARILRTQFLSQLQFIENHLAPKTRPLTAFEQELFEPLQAMWMQADLLEPEEMEAVHRTCLMLLMLRKKPAWNKKDVNAVTDAMQQTYRVFEASTSPPGNASK
jgi:hypothetical protein